MSNTVVQMALYRQAETPNLPLFSQDKNEGRRAVAFRVTQQLGDRMYFPDYVTVVASATFFPLAVRRHAEAVYENAVRFLDMTRRDESFL